MTNMEAEKKVFTVVILLAIVQAILVPGPLRENIEIWLFLQPFPIIDFIIQFGNLVSYTEQRSIIFYIKLLIILLQDIATLWFYKIIKDRFSIKMTARD